MQLNAGNKQLVTNPCKQRDVTTRFLDPVSEPFLEHKLSLFRPKNRPTFSFSDIFNRVSLTDTYRGNKKRKKKFRVIYTLKSARDNKECVIRPRTSQRPKCKFGKPKRQKKKKKKSNQTNKPSPF